MAAAAPLLLLLLLLLRSHFGLYCSTTLVKSCTFSTVAMVSMQI
jgi:hypothetical protein